MIHDFSIVFDTESEYWQRVLDIFAANETYPKKKTKGRELHHKFPRSFSKKLGEDVDNTEENLISLSPADHFRVHYYYYLLANKGYRQPMALAFQLMVRSPSKQISPATMEEMAFDYEELRREAIVARADAIKKWSKNNPEAVKLKNEHIKESQNKPEVAQKKSKSMKGKNAGSANGMYGKSTAIKGHSCTDWMTEEEVDRWKNAISKTLTGRVKTEEECKHISESKMGSKNPMFRRFSWKDENGKFKNINLPDDIKDEELGEYRFLLHFFAGKDWRTRIKKVVEILEIMEELNDNAEV